jgi:two-component system chemotaxis response regulator CheB
LEGLCQELIPKIKQFFAGDAGKAETSTPRLAATPARFELSRTAAPRPTFRVDKPGIVVVGVSTGGPTALLDLLPRLPRDFPLPIAIVQHMPPVFTGQLAARLNAQCAIEVVEASDGLELRPGVAMIAPGDFHMRLKRAGTEVVVRLDQGERENSCRPAVDALFRSAGEIFGGSVVSVILTGMGQDGLRGVSELKRLGATVIAQDKQSSVVWGMPGAVVEAGLADSVLELNEIATELLRLVRPR